MVAYLLVEVIVSSNDAEKLLSVWFDKAISCPQSISLLGLVTKHDLIDGLVLHLCEVFIVTPLPSVLDYMLLLENQMGPQDLPLLLCDSLMTEK